ncbi:hypothetical protein WCLP8_3080006 [uncultured Gammaproteobacteria bacterium]
MFNWLKRLVFSGNVALEPTPVVLPPLDDRTMILAVELPETEDRVGQLWLRSTKGETIAGPFPANGKADSRIATLMGNPERAPQLPYGNVASGVYQLEAVVAPGSHNYHLQLLGPNGALIFYPTAAANHTGPIPGPTRRLTVHGGGQVSDATYGSLRLPDEVMLALLTALADGGNLARALQLSVTLTNQVDDTEEEVWHVSSDEGGNPHQWPDYSGASEWYRDHAIVTGQTTAESATDDHITDGRNSPTTETASSYPEDQTTSDNSSYDGGSSDSSSSSGSDD